MEIGTVTKIVQFAPGRQIVANIKISAAVPAPETSANYSIFADGYLNNVYRTICNFSCASQISEETRPLLNTNKTLQFFKAIFNTSKHQNFH